MIMDYQEALQYISSVSWKGSVPGLERITELLGRLGNPQDSLKFIHIGGTNGKGSTAAFLSHILKQAGYKTGLFISPFIEVFNERMQIDNVNIPDAELAEITTYIQPFADAMRDAPTEFELNTAIAMLYFQKNHCDIVVLEVGMGGEFDATNVIGSPEAAVLTAIGLDHMVYLGDTVQKIAATKAGIIKDGCPVVLYRQSDEITDVIREKCRLTGSELFLTEPDTLHRISGDINGQVFDSPHGELHISLAAAYQQFNLATALKTAEVLIRKGWHITDEDIREGLRKTTWPGRFEVLHGKPVFLVDGAHNPHGMKAAADSLRAVFQDQKLIIIFGVMADKDYEQMLGDILPMAKEFFCVSPENARAMDAAALAERIRQIIGSEAEQQDRETFLDPGHVKAFSSVKDAVDAAFQIAEESDVICAIGSLYMIGDIKESLRRMQSAEHVYDQNNKVDTMKMTDNTCKEFVAVLASKAPVPGGGGSAALCGAIGTALGNMVGSLTVGKKKYAGVEEEILALKAKCDTLQDELLELVQQDAEAFSPLSEAYRLPAETEEEKQFKADRLEQCSKDACKVPLMIMQKCCEAIELVEIFAEKGSRLAVSDAGCGAAILRGALQAASLNIYINTKNLADRTFAEEVNKQADNMLAVYTARAEQIFEKVRQSL